MRHLFHAASSLLLASAASAGTVTVSPAGPITTIQGGLDAAVPGDTVVVLEGTYNGDFTNTKSSLVIRGVGTVVVLGNGDFVGAKRCVFQNFTMNGTDTALHLDQDSHGNVLSGLSVSSIGPLGLWIEGQRNSVLNFTASATDTAVLVNGAFNTVMNGLAGPTSNDDAVRLAGERNLARKCLALGSADDGFEVNGRANALLQCASVGASAAGFRVGGNGASLSKCVAHSNAESGATIAGNGNLVSKCAFGTEGANIGPGILFDGANGNLVTACLISGNAGGGIDLGSGGNDLHNRLERNRVTGNTGPGILLSSSNQADDNWLERNLVSGNTGDGIRVEGDHNVLLTNTSSGNGGAEINILGSNNLSVNNKTP
jgi:parallel beta-helix repeat protein